MKIVRADGGALIFSEGNARMRIVETTQGPFDARFWEQARLMEEAQKVIDSGEPLIHELGANTSVVSSSVLPEGVQSFIAFPLRTPTRAIGVLNLVRMQGREPFSNVDLEIINVLSSQASISIENVRLYENIRDNYLKTIRAFALAVEAKDHFTHGHSANVEKYAMVLARALGLPEYEIELVRYAGLLHDIGKIGISEAILNKPGRLTPEEFEEIKKHPELGTRIIADVPFFKPLVPMIRHHHEFFNGQGYPEGRAGDAIPYGAQILSVADAFEAMTADRPYRKAMPRESAVEILLQQKGSQFSPKIVDTFISILPQIPPPK